MNHILARHEQGAIHAAEGYARITQKPGVCIVTSGPGATNVVTGIADAMMDSLPLVVITGQVGTQVIGTDAFQEADMLGITMPITKHNFQIRSVDELAQTVKEAFHIAVTGRPGPVLIDLPKIFHNKSQHFTMRKKSIYLDTNQLLNLISNKFERFWKSCRLLKSLFCWLELEYCMLKPVMN